MHLTGLARVARDAGITVREVPGWQTRSAHKGGMNKVVGVIWHHTATPAASVMGRNNPTVQYMTNGLGYPLTNYALAWDGSLDVISAGTGAHAGKGSYRGVPNNDGNRHMIGVEVEGTIGLTWSPAQLETAARLGAALNRDFGTELIHIAHYEWAPGRKTDPTGIPGMMPALRAAIHRGYWAAPITVQSTNKTPAPAKTSTPEGELSMSDIKTIIDRLDKLEGRVNNVPKDVWGHTLNLPRGGGETTTGAIQASGYMNGKEAYALTKALAEKTGLSAAEIEAIIRDSIKEGLASGVSLEANLTVKEAN